MELGRRMWLPCLTTLMTVTCIATADDSNHDRKVDLLMPNVQPKTPDIYLCYGMKMDDVPAYITGFIPKASKDVAHHVLIYGCGEPGSTEEVWDCGEMHSSSDDYKSNPVCKTEQSILYAWAMDAPQLTLPEGVGFKVGGKTNVQWLVLQVHYKDVSSFLAPYHLKDSSGVTLEVTDQPQPKRAGVYLLGTGGEIPPHSTTYMETACSYNKPFDMHPFAFRTHAHTHGEVISGYRVRDGEWTEIGRRSPQKPQMFYNVTHPGMVVKQGDILAARCTMVNDEDKAISIGATTKDEMCNFYVMYYVDGDHNIADSYCFTPGPPSWNWLDFGGIHFENVPMEASMIPDTKKFLAATGKFFEQMDDVMEAQNDQLDAELAEILRAMNVNEDDYRMQERLSEQEANLI